MKRSHLPPGLFHVARDTAEADRMARMRPKSFASTADQFFVPSFAIRRPVLLTGEATQFITDLTTVFPKNYRISPVQSLAMTLVEQRKIVNVFRSQEEVPDPERIEKVAMTVAEQIGKSLHGFPRKLDIPLGGIFAFGHKGDRKKLGVVPQGWKGPSAHYAERDMFRKPLPIPQIIRETNIAVGALANEFMGNDELTKGLQGVASARTPHIAFAKKERGGPISQTEEISFAGSIDEIKPSVLTVFDPIIYLRLEEHNPEPVIIYTRAPRLRNHAALLPYDL